MSWERKALEKIILLTIQQSKESGEFYESLDNLGIHIDIADSSYKIIKEITDWELLPESMEAVHDGVMTNEQFINFCLEYIKGKFIE